MSGLRVEKWRGANVPIIGVRRPASTTKCRDARIANAELVAVDLVRLRSARARSRPPTRPARRHESRNGSYAPHSCSRPSPAGSPRLRVSRFDRVFVDQTSPSTIPCSNTEPCADRPSADRRNDANASATTLPRRHVRTVRINRPRPRLAPALIDACVRRRARSRTVRASTAGVNGLRRNTTSGSSSYCASASSA